MRWLLPSCQHIDTAPCVDKMAIEEEKVFGQRKKVLRRSPVLLNLTFCDFPKSTTLLKKQNPKECIFTESSQSSLFLLCLPKEIELRYVFQDQGSLHKEEKSSFFPPASVSIPTPSSGNMHQVQTTRTTALIPNCVCHNDSFLDHLEELLLLVHDSNQGEDHLCYLRDIGPDLDLHFIWTWRKLKTVSSTVLLNVHPWRAHFKADCYFTIKRDLLKQNLWGVGPQNLPFNKIPR